MQKVQFSATVKVPKAKKGVVPNPSLMVSDVVDVSIKGKFTVKESGALEGILRSWHKGDVKESVKKVK